MNSPIYHFGTLMDDDTQVVLSHEFFKSWLFFSSRPFSYGLAFIDLATLTVTAPKNRCFASGFIEATDNQALVTHEALANRWGWSRQNVRTFLKKLVGAGMIIIDSSTTEGTRITLTCDEMVEVIKNK